MLLLTLYVIVVVLILSHIYEMIYVWSLKTRLERLESVLSGLGPDAYRKIEAANTRVVVGDRWADEAQF